VRSITCDVVRQRRDRQIADVEYLQFLQDQLYVSGQQDDCRLPANLTQDSDPAGKMPDYCCLRVDRVETVFGAVF